MGKYLLCLMLCAILLCSCAHTAPEPTKSTFPISDLPETTTAPAETLPPQSPASDISPTTPKEVTPAWVPKPYTSVSYPQYLALTRTPVYSSSHWCGQDDQTEYFLKYTAEGYCVSSNTAEGMVQTHWTVPNSNAMGDAVFYICDGVWAYGIRNNGQELMRMSLTTGEVETLFTAKRFLCGSDSLGVGTNLYLADRDWLYFLALDNGVIGLYRMYLPTKTLDRLHTEIPATTLPHALYLIPPETTAKIQIVYMDAPMQELVVQHLRDSKSNYRTSIYVPVYSPEQNGTLLQKIDFNPLWELDDWDSTMLWNPMLDYLSILLQNNHNIPAKRICTYEVNTRTISDLAAWATACESIHIAAKHLVAVESPS